MKKNLFTTIILLFIICSPIFSQKKQKESYYKNYFADTIKGMTEVILDDKSRVDIVTDSFAIEVDFAPKWAESVISKLNIKLWLIDYNNNKWKEVTIK